MTYLLIIPRKHPPKGHLLQPRATPWGRTTGRANTRQHCRAGGTQPRAHTRDTRREAYTGTGTPRPSVWCESQPVEQHPAGFIPNPVPEAGSFQNEQQSGLLSTAEARARPRFPKQYRRWVFPGSCSSRISTWFLVGKVRRRSKGTSPAISERQLLGVTLATMQVGALLRPKNKNK